MAIYLLLMRHETDFLVIGSGLAGLGFALKVADYGQVTVLTKTSLLETNTSYAQGGIAAVTSKNDTYEQHVRDTLEAGDNLSDEEVVRMVISEAPGQIKELVNWGTQFDRNKSGTYELAREGGHSARRILHYKDHTGAEIQRNLVKQVKKHPNINIFENYFAVDIITQHHLGETVTKYRDDITCFGAYALNEATNEIETILSRITYMGAGGIGNIYQTTTNPRISTGDAIAMVYRAKGITENMEFVQFHPTALYEPGVRPSFLITEALRGYGAVLKNPAGEGFMRKYDKRADLAPRDIVARAIDHEIKIRGADHMYLDATACPPDGLKKDFPNIYKKSMQLGLDITRNWLPVRPAAHFVCGGIKVNMDGQSSINRLYAGGENASTGLHGANRLASNSLLEAIVFADRAARHARQRISDIKQCYEVGDWDNSGTSKPEEMILITQEFLELQAIMSNYVGIVRSNLRLERALKRLEIIYKETEELYRRATLSRQLGELRNSINVAYIIIKMARRRKESRGLHFNIDHPRQIQRGNLP